MIEISVMNRNRRSYPPLAGDRVTDKMVAAGIPSASGQFGGAYGHCGNAAAYGQCSYWQRAIAERNTVIIERRGRLMEDMIICRDGARAKAMMGAHGTDDFGMGKA